MKLADGFVLREIAGESILIPVGVQATVLDGMVTLSASGAVIWKALSEKADYDYALKAVLDEFDVTEETAKQDLDDFLKQLKENGLLE